MDRIDVIHIEIYFNLVTTSREQSMGELTLLVMHLRLLVVHVKVVEVSLFLNPLIIIQWQ